MGNLRRRTFIFFLGFLPASVLWPFLLHGKNNGHQNNSRAAEMFGLLSEKMDSIRTISYSVSRKAVYVDNTIKRYFDPELPHEMFLEVYCDRDKELLKTVVYMPTESSQSAFGAKMTTVFKEKFSHEKYESLDGSFETEYRSHNLSSFEKTDFSSYLDDVMAAPKDDLFTCVKIEKTNGDQIYVILQGDSKYWISKEKVSVVRKEIFRDSGSLIRRAEYKNFVEVRPGISLPTVVVDKHFSENNKIGIEYRREITNIKVNEVIPGDTFRLNFVCSREETKE